MKRLAAGAALLSALSALAQVPPDAGGVLRDVEKPRPALPKKPPARLELEEPARAPLKAAPAVRFTLKAFRITGSSAFAESELQALVREFVGREVGLAELDEAAARITRHYRDRGYMVARAYLPQQDIRDGVVEIAVLEGRLGKVELNNRSRVSDAVIARHLDGVTGDVVNEGRLERKLLLLSDLAGIGTSGAALRPGDRVGESALALELGEARAALARFELDNHGSYFTGEYRLTGELELASPARQGDLLTVRAIMGTPDFAFVRLGYQLPLGGDGLRAGVAYSDLRYRLGKDFSSLQAHGSATSAEGALSYPLVRSRVYNISAQLGFTHREFDDRIDATSTVTDKSTDVARLGLSGDWRDGWGGAAVNAWSLAYGHGELDIDTPVARLIDDATVRTQGSFDKLNWSLLRAQRVATRFSGLISLSGQHAGKNLDSSEKFTLGGPYGVRAYPVGEAPGDEGVLANAEVRYDVIPASLQAGVFLDAGEVKLNRDPLPGAGDNVRRLSALGASLNWTTQTGFAARAIVAWGNKPATSSPDRDPRVWLQLLQRL
jgi:hemolysin activation/secretion protein